MDAFLSKITKLIDMFAANKKLTKKEMKLQDKPWITKGILTASRKRDIIFRKFKRLKEPIKKREVHELYKTYRNMISSLIWRSKKNYMTKYFTKHSSNLRKTWNGIIILIIL